VTLRLLPLIFLAFVLAACGTTAPYYSTGVPLSTAGFTARGGGLTGSVPEGWFSSADDSLAPALSAWLTRNDFSATITFRELQLDAGTAHRVSDALQSLLAADAGFLGELASTLSEPKEFEFHGIRFCAGEFSTDRGPTRLVVFGIKGIYYECRASKVGGEWSQGDIQKLFTVQQTVLSTLRY
jgi:hypothetical protein